MLKLLSFLKQTITLMPLLDWIYVEISISHIIDYQGIIFYRFTQLLNG